MYRALTEEQLLHLYPGKQAQVKMLLAHLVRQGRVFHSGDGLYCADEAQSENVDRGLLAAVWVLVDLIDRVEYHSVSDYPAKLIFFADGEVYEVVHAAYGQEALISHVLSDTVEDPPNYIILVDKPEQITALQVPNAGGFCIVSPDGEVQYYRKEQGKERVFGQSHSIPAHYIYSGRDRPADQRTVRHEHRRPSALSRQL